MDFIVYALPRSRTFWLSRFLEYGGWRCAHEEILHLHSMQDVADWFSLPHTGSVETAASPYWRLIQQRQPDIKTVIIRRPPEECIDSLLRLGIFDPDRVRHTVMMSDHKLDQIEQRVPNVMSIPYRYLKDETVCAGIFEHCLGLPHDHAWWLSMDQFNLQINVPHMMEYYAAYETQLTKLAKIAKYQMVADFARKPQIDKDDGMVIREESFDAVYEDGKALLAEHCVLSGDAPDSYPNRNLHLMRGLDEKGLLHVMTARCNGKMFGYVMAIISPSVNSQTMLGGAEVTFFASKEFPGLGLKLQRASIAAMKAKGVTDVFFHTSNLADGPRSSTLYRRLGATQHGEMYRLSLD